jgi:hypothetical protein
MGFVRDQSGDQRFSVSAWTCLCGWWLVEKITTTAMHFEGFRLDSSIDTDRWYAILRSFSVEPKEAPLEALRQALVARKDALYDITPKEMEDLTCAVFSDFFHCEVIGCGRSGDGGVDAFMTLCDESFAFQVKRRVRPGKTEPVGEIREFLGAMVLGQYKGGLFVTTADKFSKPAMEAASRAVELGKVKRFELFDKERFVDIINSTSMRRGNSPSGEPREPWQVVFRNQLSDR